MDNRQTQKPITIAEECRFSGWDGYDAEPVRNGTILAAHCFIECLPCDVPAPTIGAEPDGEVTLEWHHSPGRTLSVSIGRHNVLSYSAIVGSDKYFGTKAFADEVPKAIRKIIRLVQD